MGALLSGLGDLVDDAFAAPNMFWGWFTTAERQAAESKLKVPWQGGPGSQDHWGFLPKGIHAGNPPPQHFWSQYYFHGGGAASYKSSYGVVSNPNGTVRHKGISTDIMGMFAPNLLVTGDNTTQEFNVVASNKGTATTWTNNPHASFGMVFAGCEKDGQSGCYDRSRACSALNYPWCNMTGMRQNAPTAISTWDNPTESFNLIDRYRIMVDNLAQAYSTGGFEELSAVNKVDPVAVDPCAGSGKGILGRIIPTLAALGIVIVMDIVVDPILPITPDGFPKMALSLVPAITVYNLTSYNFARNLFGEDSDNAKWYRDMSLYSLLSGGGFFLGSYGAQILEMGTVEQLLGGLGVGWALTYFLWTPAQVIFVSNTWLGGAVFQLVDWLTSGFHWLICKAGNAFMSPLPPCYDNYVNATARVWDYPSLAAMLTDNVRAQEGWTRSDPRSVYVFKGLLMTHSLLDLTLKFDTYKGGPSEFTPGDGFRGADYDNLESVSPEFLGWGLNPLGVIQTSSNRGQRDVISGVAPTTDSDIGNEYAWYEIGSGNGDWDCGVFEEMLASSGPNGPKTRFSAVLDPLVESAKKPNNIAKAEHMYDWNTTDPQYLAPPNNYPTYFSDLAKQGNFNISPQYTLSQWIATYWNFPNWHPLFVKGEAFVREGINTEVPVSLFDCLNSGGGVLCSVANPTTFWHDWFMSKAPPGTKGSPDIIELQNFAYNMFMNGGVGDIEKAKLGFQLQLEGKNQEIGLEYARCFISYNGLALCAPDPADVSRGIPFHVDDYFTKLYTAATQSIQSWKGKPATTQNMMEFFGLNYANVNAPGSSEFAKVRLGMDYVNDGSNKELPLFFLLGVLFTQPVPVPDIVANYRQIVANYATLAYTHDTGKSSPTPDELADWIFKQGKIDPHNPSPYFTNLMTLNIYHANKQFTLKELSCISQAKSTFEQCFPGLKPPAETAVFEWGAQEDPFSIFAY